MIRVLCLGLASAVQAFAGCTTSSPNATAAPEPPQTAQELHEEATSYFKAGLYAEALDAFRRAHAAADEPAKELMLHNIAVAAAKAGECAAAVQAWERLGTNPALSEMAANARESVEADGCRVDEVPPPPPSPSDGVDPKATAPAKPLFPKAWPQELAGKLEVAATAGDEFHGLRAGKARKQGPWIEWQTELVLPGTKPCTVRSFGGGPSHVNCPVLDADSHVTAFWDGIRGHTPPGWRAGWRNPNDLDEGGNHLTSTIVRENPVVLTKCKRACERALHLERSHPWIVLSLEPWPAPIPGAVAAAGEDVGEWGKILGRELGRIRSADDETLKPLRGDKLHYDEEGGDLGSWRAPAVLPGTFDCLVSSFVGDYSYSCLVGDDRSSQDFWRDAMRHPPEGWVVRHIPEAMRDHGTTPGTGLMPAELSPPSNGWQCDLALQHDAEWVVVEWRCWDAPSGG